MEQGLFISEDGVKMIRIKRFLERKCNITSRELDWWGGDYRLNVQRKDYAKALTLGAIFIKVNGYDKDKDIQWVGLDDERKYNMDDLIGIANLYYRQKKYIPWGEIEYLGNRTFSSGNFEDVDLSDLAGRTFNAECE